MIFSEGKMTTTTISKPAAQQKKQSKGSIKSVAQSKPFDTADVLGSMASFTKSAEQKKKKANQH